LETGSAGEGNKLGALAVPQWPPRFAALRQKNPAKNRKIFVVSPVRRRYGVATKPQEISHDET